MNYNIAILGASGAVGSELMQLISERNFPVGELRLLSSPRSAGKQVDFKGETLTIQAVDEKAFHGIDIAFFCAGGGVSRQWVDKAVAQGTLVIDNTSAFRLDDDVPLVVPEVNGDAIATHRGVIANANCSTTIMAMALAPIHRAFGIKRVVVSTYQAVSGAGIKGMEELDDQIRSTVEGRKVEARFLPVASGQKHHPIAMNVIPQVDVFDELGYTKEEWKMVHETRKILSAPDMAISPTTVRVPVMRSHAESLNVETEQPVTAEDVRGILQQADGIVVVDDPEQMDYPMPITAAGKDPVYVGRVRRDPTLPNAVNMWVVGDQIRKGAALNALQIAEYAVEHDWLRPASQRTGSDH